jgi:phosphatidylserine/phosphatidylglycerophosphate/cardiolipin synthase-like enzyme
VTPDFRGVEVGIARTAPPDTEGRGAIHEIAELDLAIIRDAKHTLYIENQYLTSAAVVRALSQRLAQPEGPEIVIVLPKVECGWMEQSSMGVLRANALEALHRADRGGRLHVYHPVLPGLGAACVNVHSKVIVADDRLLKVGSSNLSNRSLGVDTECDLAIEANDDAPATRAAISSVMQRLVAEHLGLEPSEVARGLAQHGSLAAMIEARRDSQRHLEPLVDVLPEGVVNLAFLDGVIVDPERPIDADAFFERLAADADHARGAGPWWRRALSRLRARRLPRLASTHGSAAR